MEKFWFLVQAGEIHMDLSLPYPSKRAPVMARNIISTSQPLATQAGLQMLQAGGNAVDAALAAAITLTVVEPTGNGLGSDAFAIVHDGTKLHGLNASGRAPAAWTPERFAGQAQMPRNGWESVTVPGAVSAWVALSDRFGKLPFEQLFEPAIGYARNGFAVSPIIAGLWQSGAEQHKDQPGFREAFMPEGRAPKAGEIYRNENMARSLEAIAQSKGESFYRGELAEKMVAFAQEHDAALSLEDLAANAPDWTGTVAQDYRDVKAHEIPPNGQGIAALIALGILQHTDVAEHGPDSPEAIHLQIEAMKLALADVYANVGDPATMVVSSEQLLDPDYHAERAKLITHGLAGDPGHGLPKPSGTVYLCAADADGCMVSFIQSNYSGFGSGVVVPGTGISLQNRGSGFSLEPGHPNLVGPGKRPFHTIIPGFLTRAGQPLTALGVMGGPIQAQGHMQVVVRMVLYNQNPQAAIDAPRWRMMSGRSVAMETSFDPATIAQLRDWGHEISLNPPEAAFGFGGAQIVHRMDNGHYIAGSDPRKDGHAAGF
ncbi:gamma-glutamyltransferase family protein [Natronohydrobacter thiooxidans]|uniref:gamma-glutamyltransferase family protein n=1 Tax=Natronohydrobacter thiooxidans TaxID=87172 RepID=UPI002481D269|nr:gamma-glutamyltransferase family protein [Natronohydrobacter thiooxidans]